MIRIALPVFFVGIVAFTSEIGQAQEAAKPDIRGTIKSVNITKNAKDILAVILVEGPKGQPNDKASIRVTKATKLFILTGKDRKAAKVEDLKVGVNVEAKFVGPVAESYPVQANAGEIVILAR
ncbi:MAG: hypothetical protein EXS16_06445 [Gemmataceae bacterium]|nr:hypothetical protein [Gemmataceae bacterium]